jgi:hypothetical protein
MGQPSQASPRGTQSYTKELLRRKYGYPSVKRKKARTCQIGAGARAEKAGANVREPAEPAKCNDFSPSDKGTCLSQVGSRWKAARRWALLLGRSRTAITQWK